MRTYGIEAEADADAGRFMPGKYDVCTGGRAEWPHIFEGDFAINATLGSYR